MSSQIVSDCFEALNLQFILVSDQVNFNEAKELCQEINSDAETLLVSDFSRAGSEFIIDFVAENGGGDYWIGVEKNAGDGDGADPESYSFIDGIEISEFFFASVRGEFPWQVDFPASDGECVFVANNELWETANQIECFSANSLKAFVCQQECVEEEGIDGLLILVGIGVGVLLLFAVFVSFVIARRRAKKRRNYRSKKNLSSAMGSNLSSEPGSPRPETGYLKDAAVKTDSEKSIFAPSSQFIKNAVEQKKGKSAAAATNSYLKETLMKSPSEKSIFAPSDQYLKDANTKP